MLYFIVVLCLLCNILYIIYLLHKRLSEFLVRIISLYLLWCLSAVYPRHKSPDDGKKL